LPLAREGLRATAIDSADIDRYLGVIEERVASSRNGSQWMLDSFNAMQDLGTASERHAALAAAIHDRQTRPDLPVHRWEPARLEEAGGWKDHYRRVGQLMTTDLFTVQEDELVDLVAHLMHWKHIRHVPVEDAQHRLVGLVTHRSLLRLFQDGLAFKASEPVPVSEIMQHDVVTATPQMSTLEAIQLMRDEGIACLPVINDDDRLVGIITERDFMGIAGDLFEKFMSEPKNNPETQ